MRSRSSLQAMLLLGLSLATVAGCAPECPVGYEPRLDQCVKVVAAALPHPCAVLEPEKIDEQGSALMSRVDYAEDRCFWIDQTEVTAGKYAEWIEEEPSVSSWHPDFCQWKTERSDPARDRTVCDEPISAFDRDPFGANKPIRCVDYCDAEAYCRFRGKYLCYDNNSGGTTGPRGYPRAWRIACTSDFVSTLPYGDDQDEDRCRTGQEENGCLDTSCGPTTVGEYDECSTPSGVLDMIGNVAEWTYGCHTFNPSDPTCLVRGGGYDESDVFCGDERIISNRSRLPDLGFRCCADLTVSELARVD